MASNTRKMSTERTTALLSQWKELEPEFQKAKAALMAAKDRDDMYTSLVADAKLDEALDQAEEYSHTMTEAKRGFESIRMIIETISPEDMDHPTIKDIMATWDPYVETYKRLTRNYCSAYSFRKKRLKEIEIEDYLRDKTQGGRGQLQGLSHGGRGQPTGETRHRGDETQCQPRHKKKLEVEQAMNGPATSGTTTPASRESPVPPAATQLSKQDISQFKPTNCLSSELSFIEMQDWKEEVLNWFEIEKHTDLQISMQKHLLKTVVDPDMWLKACYTFEAQDSHTVMIDKLVSQFEDITAAIQQKTTILRPKARKMRIFALLHDKDGAPRSLIQDPGDGLAQSSLP